MTASKTPNLGLMNPVGSDPFNTSDFSDTFSKLDLTPGVLVVDNAASRPTGYSAAQHGRLVWQSDLNIMWVWNQPSSSVAGAWLRSSTKGWLGGAFNASQVNTTAITVATAPTVCSFSATIPGGRCIFVNMRWIFIGNDTARFATINLMANSSNVLEARFNGNGFGVAYSGGTPYPPQSASYGYIYGMVNSQQTINFQLKLRCQDPAVVGSAQGGGSCFIIGASIDIFEL
jgi:hypothetical protein